MLKRDYKSSGSRYEVIASTINFKPYILGMKMLALAKAKDSCKDILAINRLHFDDYELAQLVNTILEKTEGSVEDQKVLRDIVDWQFRKTKQFFYIQLIVYLIFYFIPFLIQMTHKDFSEIYYYNMSCMISQIVFLCFEAVTMKAAGIVDHFESHWNKIDFLNILVYTIYFYYRIYHD